MPPACADARIIFCISPALPRHLHSTAYRCGLQLRALKYEFGGSAPRHRQSSRQKPRGPRPPTAHWPCTWGMARRWCRACSPEERDGRASDTPCGQHESQHARLGHSPAVPRSCRDTTSCPSLNQQWLRRTALETTLRNSATCSVPDRPSSLRRAFACVLWNCLA